MQRSARLLVRPGRICMLSVVWYSASMFAQSPGATGPAHVTHILGFEDIPNNAGGELSIQEDGLEFRRSQGPAARISTRSIQNVSLGSLDKQVGGVPMALGRAATPFGGGRVIGLFSHKKYDTLTVEYADTNGGLHGAVFQLDKGQAELIRNKLTKPVAFGDQK